MSLKMISRATLLAAGLLLPSPFLAPSHAADGTKVTIYKSAQCGCCGDWAAALEKAGYKIETNNIDDLDWAKQQFSVPEEMEACHTAIVDGYVVEGHVPLEALAKLLKDRPKVRGISAPGMPMGSLGMEYDPKARYTIYAFGLPDQQAPQPFYEAGQ